MIVKIPSKANQEQIYKTLEKSIKLKKTFVIDKYFGKIKWSQDPLEFQKEIREE
jgi:hypothetical protein